jgi:hypothetical protein
MDLEIFLWAIAGGLFIATISGTAAYYQKIVPSNKQLSRDFLLGAAFTGFLYPLIPESFDDIKDALKTTAGDIQNGISTRNITSGIDPGVKVGPANF